jgi:hypothetical protein
MNPKTLDRVVFYSIHDGASGQNLINAEKLLRNGNTSSLSDINDLLEYYHIKLYFDNQLFLLTWDDTTKKEFTGKVEQVQLLVKDFFLKIDDLNFPVYVEGLEYDYQSAFWNRFNYFQSYKRINKNIFLQTLKDHPHHIHYVLSQNKTVGHFNNEIRDFLVGYESAAELLLSEIEERERSRDVKYIFPKSLSLKDREDIISSYLDQEEPNLNYVRLIEFSKDSGELTLSRNVRLKAKKKSEELNQQILDNSNAEPIGIEIAFDKTQAEPEITTHEILAMKISYSESYMDAQTSDARLFMLFKELFHYIDSGGLISLYSRESGIGVIERMMMESKNQYPTGFHFRHKQQVAYMQLRMFDQYLKRKNRSLEELIASFIDQAFNKHFHLENMRLTFPGPGLSCVEKIRALAPELESILKQYEVYIEEGKIDFELIAVDAVPLSFSGVKSPMEKKYAYSRDNKVAMLAAHFYSDQSRLHYVPPYHEKYSSVFDMVQNESLTIDAFKNYQQDLINHLITEGYLFTDPENNIRIKNVPLLFLIGELHRHEVISYWHYDDELRNVIDEMEKEGLIEFDNNLFSRPEVSYFNFYLNKKGFTNGMNIRNKYAHGSDNSSPGQQEYEYYVLLQMIVLAILKIADDLSLQLNVLKSSVTNPSAGGAT